MGYALFLPFNTMGNIIMFGAGYYTVSDQLKAAFAVGLFAWQPGRSPLWPGFPLSACTRQGDKAKMSTTRKPLPPMARVRQSFTRPRVDDPVAAMTAQMCRLAPRIQAGATVGITAGSRGIQNICPMLAAAIAVVRECGATPVLLAAMGSHGGGTAQGQKEVLDSLGITEQNMGVKVITCDTCRSIGQTPDGLWLHMLDSAFSVDAIPINCVKTYTSFQGLCESGMCKKTGGGSGRLLAGAGQFHSLGQSQLPRLLVDGPRSF